MLLEVTDTAAKRVLEIITQGSGAAHSSSVGLRVSVDGGGCSGFMYNYEIVDSISEDDAIIEKNGIKVLVDPVSLEFLKGCTLDFINELGSSYFQVKNPSAVAKCGCGKSFSVM